MIGEQRRAWGALLRGCRLGGMEAKETVSRAGCRSGFLHWEWDPDGCLGSPSALYRAGLGYAGTRSLCSRNLEQNICCQREIRPRNKQHWWCGVGASGESAQAAEWFQCVEAAAGSSSSRASASSVLEWVARVQGAARPPPPPIQLFQRPA